MTVAGFHRQRRQNQIGFFQVRQGCLGLQLAVTPGAELGY